MKRGRFTWKSHISQRMNTNSRTVGTEEKSTNYATDISLKAKIRQIHSFRGHRDCGQRQYEKYFQGHSVKTLLIFKSISERNAAGSHKIYSRIKTNCNANKNQIFQVIQLIINSLLHVTNYLSQYENEMYYNCKVISLIDLYTVIKNIIDYRILMSIATSVWKTFSTRRSNVTVQTWKYYQRA